ncbi:hypothetical protein K458DRAFT_370889 [Lentithecium fluviatile CBS 122367]|uniref:Heterokaryon incompatibility domain-containing protein n=1 Tax=Lentithecium fluviatile CBS 122367 TaxID=1168545 RepID=A0A6G1IW85_9PLEO|nr:hypothetical protein K458DRAFT_370889 [Lentithecium fluviatile CBS 122367]
MDRVYSHSYCNISVLAAADSSQGLFFPRNPHSFRDTEAEVCIRGFKSTADSADYIKCMVLDGCMWSDQVTRAPLNQRGWVLQERLLSPRVLHFGRQQLFWECKEQAAAECYPYGLPQLMSYFAQDFKHYLLPLVPTQQRPIWEDIVYVYSRTKLTNNTDKLIALSGLAKRMGAISQDDFVAGIWRQKLPAQLLWTVSSSQNVDGRPSCRYKAYFAPTWSWASVNGKISFRSIGIEKTLLFVAGEPHLEHCSANRTGAVRGGHLDLQGWLRSFYLTGRGLPRHVANWNTHEGHVGAHVNIEEIHCKSSKNWIYLDDPQRDYENQSQTGAFWCMIGGVGPISNRKGIYSHCILLKVVDKEQGVYERIGMVFMRFDIEDADAILERFKGIPMETPVSCRAYSEGMHTIRII